MQDGNIMDETRVQQLIEQGHPRASALMIFQLEEEKAAAIYVAEQAVLNAINVLQSH